MEPIWDADTLLSVCATVKGTTLCYSVAGNCHEQKG